VGAVLVIVGFLFKVASVPFQMWMPDVYEGAPVPVTGFMTTAIKAASFAAFVRVLASLGIGKGLAEAAAENLHHILWACAVLTMVIGNVIALVQTNMKRMLAYSSIAHTGYLLVGMVTGSQSEEGFSPVLVYLISYTLMNLGAFMALTALASRSQMKGDQGLNLHDLAGLGKRHPWLAFAMAVFMFSMAGIPGTAGFIGKYFLFYSAVQSGEILLVILSVLCSAISVYYYLRVLVFLYLRDPQEVPGQMQEARLGIAFGPAVALASMTVLTLQVGILPAGILEVVRSALVGM
jgi:NADH-quinone oxidoreductase subunit N